MRRKRVLAALAAAAFVAIAPAGGAEPGPGYFASENVEHILHVPLNNDAAGARLVGKYLYITTSRDLKIYDVSDPDAPKETGSLVLPQMPYFAEEDVDTNGEILLIDTPNYYGTLNVVDVEDKSNPTVIGTLPGVDQHTMTCLLDCTWAYGSSGAIVDLRDPTQPRLRGDWREDLWDVAAHDVTEVAPGIVVTSSDPVYVLDARRPTRPKVLATASMKYDRAKLGNIWMVHGNEWPRRGRDRFLLTSGESTGPDCGESHAVFAVWDTTGWRRRHSMRAIARYAPGNGLPTDGQAPADVFCSHWFDAHPDFHNGGTVALAWYDHGVRFLDVAPSGSITEKGYFMPVGGSMSAAYWVTDEIVYSVDYHRGLDVLRYRG